MLQVGVVGVMHAVEEGFDREIGTSVADFREMNSGAIVVEPAIGCCDKGMLNDADSGEDAVHVGIVVIQISRNSKFTDHFIEGFVQIIYPIIRPDLSEDTAAPSVGMGIVRVKGDGALWIDWYDTRKRLAFFEFRQGKWIIQLSQCM